MNVWNEILNKIYFLKRYIYIDFLFNEKDFVVFYLPFFLDPSLREDFSIWIFVSIKNYKFNFDKKYLWIPIFPWLKSEKEIEFYFLLNKLKIKLDFIILEDEKYFYFKENSLLINDIYFCKFNILLDIIYDNIEIKINKEDKTSFLGFWDLKVILLKLYSQYLLDKNKNIKNFFKKVDKLVWRKIFFYKKNIKNNLIKNNLKWYVKKFNNEIYKNNQILKKILENSFFILKDNNYNIFVLNNEYIFSNKYFCENLEEYLNYNLNITCNVYFLELEKFYFLKIFYWDYVSIDFYNWEINILKRFWE